MGCHQLHQWWDSGASGLPGPVRGAGASAQPAESQRQQNPLAHPGCHLQYSTAGVGNLWLASQMWLF